MSALPEALREAHENIMVRYETHLPLNVEEVAWAAMAAALRWVQTRAPSMNRFEHEQVHAAIAALERRRPMPKRKPVEPLPCPFCGKWPVVDGDNLQVWVSCTSAFHDATTVAATKKTAISRWNRRAK